MSRIATDWAWSVSIKPASLKLILLSMADRADEEHCCFPSILRLVKDTCLDQKTVQKGIGELADRGLIVDTGERKGSTKRVRVFRLVGVEQPNGPKKGNIPKSGNVPKNGEMNDPKNGEMNDPKNGVQNQSGESVIEPEEDSGLPDWLPVKEWEDFKQHRHEMKAPLSELAMTKAINKLDRLRKEGSPPTQVLEQSVVNGWKGLFVVKGGQVVQFPASGGSDDCGGKVYIPTPANGGGA